MGGVGVQEGIGEDAPEFAPPDLARAGAEPSLDGLALRARAVQKSEGEKADRNQGKGDARKTLGHGLGKASRLDTFAAAARDELKDLFWGQRLGLAESLGGRLQGCQPPSRHAKQSSIIRELVDAELVLVRRRAICVGQYRVHFRAAADCDQEEQAGLMRLENAVHAGTKIFGAGAGMLKHDQAFALVGPLEHGQAILNRHQGGSIGGAPGARFGENGEQTVTQVRGGDWYVWVQDAVSLAAARKSVAD